MRVGDIVSNVFKKLISKEMGEVNYHRYFSFLKKNMEAKKVDSQALYNDMYEKLKYRDYKSITKMHRRLNDTMLLAFRISKNFFFAFIVYLAATVFLVTKDLQPQLILFSMISMNICFVYKIYEFIVNKFCYIDAQIVLIYKAVLDRIILNEKREQG